MIRTQIQLREDQSRALRSTAAKEKVSLAEVVRRAVDEWIATRGTVSLDERRSRALAVPTFDSGAADVAERHDSYWDPT